MLYHILFVDLYKQRITTLGFPVGLGMGWTNSHVLLYKFFVMLISQIGLYMTLCIIH